MKTPLFDSPRRLFFMTSLLISKGLLLLIFFMIKGRADWKSPGILLIFPGSLASATLLTRHVVRSGKLTRWGWTNYGQTYRQSPKYGEEATYQIKNILFDKTKVGLLTIVVDGSLRRTVLPRITINGIFVVVTQRDHNSVFCFAEQQIKAADQSIVVASGEYSMSVLNPWHLNLEHPETEIVWQDQGHSPERKIIIRNPQTPYAKEPVPFSFKLMVEGRVQGPFSGKFAMDGDTPCLVINIAALKVKCSKKRCILRAAYDPSCEVVLPPPTILSRNHQLVGNGQK